jgi:DNA-binding transcriptional ArsR family regulator
MAAKQLELDFSGRRRAVDCANCRNLSLVEGKRTIRVNASEAKLLLFEFAKYECCFLSVQSLSERTGISKRNVERLIKALVGAGFMTVEKYTRERGEFPVNRYVVFYSELPFISPPSATPSATPSAIVADNKEDKEDKKTTTTESPWDVVVVALEKVGVGQAAKAAAKAQERGRLPADVLQQIEGLKGSSPGVIYNQVCYPTPKAVTIAKPKPVRVESREQKRHRVFMALRDRLGRVPFETEIDECLA